MKINVIGGEISRQEIDEYIEYGRKKYVGRQITGIDITLDGDFVNLEFHFGDTDFQRAYRSADYLVNDMDKINDAKQSEFKEKEKHKV
ncbi:MAG: hypothetical protein IKS03_07230 [Ruminococcus sp.]|nr:hypothetical protein [Ruminococcus sp.]